jgi:peptidylprolyl isomerase
VVAVAAALTFGLAACGGDGDEATDTSAATDASASGSPDAASSDTAPSDTASSDVPPPGTDVAGDKPTVAIPGEIPSELVISVLTAGSGAGAAEGDTVIVDYVGVLTKDGTEFDNSYESGRQPFAVTLGSGGVIPGWEQGLIGVQTGERRQLDIPSELAYGANPPPDSPITAGDALTFVVDVRAIVPPTKPQDAPTDLDIPTSTGATELGITEVTEGDGATAAPGTTALVNVLLYEGTNGTLLTNSWDASQPLQVVMDPNQTLPGIVDSIDGMKVGGRRLVIVPASLAFGAEGSANLGVAPDTDLVVVVDLLAAY